MELNPESIAAYKKALTQPKENGLDIPPLDECFEAFEEGTAKHILYEQYIAKVNKPIPKIFFYIVMDELYPITKCPDGNLGYKLKIK